MELSRRTLLALGAAVLVAACTDDTGSTPSTTASPTPEPASTTTQPEPSATTSTSTSTTTATTTATTTTEPSVDYDSDDDPFTLGVASGDPDDTSVILWTRLAPDPLQGGGL